MRGVDGLSYSISSSGQRRRSAVSSCPRMAQFDPFRTFDPAYGIENSFNFGLPEWSLSDGDGMPTHPLYVFSIGDKASVEA